MLNFAAKKKIDQGAFYLAASCELWDNAINICHALSGFCPALSVADNLTALTLEYCLSEILRAPSNTTKVI